MIQKSVVKFANIALQVKSLHVLEAQSSLREYFYTL